MILAADIGGTKTIMALYQQQDSEWCCYKKKIYPSANYSSFELLLTEFLHDEIEGIERVCIGVAGPVEGGQCITTNLPWAISAEQIAELTAAKTVKLMNDLEATAWGVLELPEDDFIELNADAEKSQGHMAVIAAGTGLGEALIICLEGEYHVVATEGGHTDFAPQNELEIELLRYLMARHSKHVSYERVICGQGLVNIYEFLKSINFAAVDEQVEQIMLQRDPAAVISEKSQDSHNILCHKAMQMFCRLYGAEAGNLALKCLPKGGVVLAGGIAAKNLSAIQEGEFISGFIAKGRYQALLETISVKVCLNPEAALIGTFNVARRS